MDLAAPLAISLLSIAAFATMIWNVRIFGLLQSLTAEVVDGLSAMFDRMLDDDAKERAVRRAGLRLVLGAWQIFSRVLIALLAAGVPIWIADFAGLVPATATLSLMIRWDYIVFVSIAAIALSWGLKRWHQPREMTAQPPSAEDQAISNSDAYRPADRMLHVLAFAGEQSLKAAAWVDDVVFLQNPLPPGRPPIFVTSLARGGTTAVMNALHGLPDIATHIYRDMPFVAAPLIWSKLSSQKIIAKRARAHGDGLTIDLDSPEAFDEVFWMLFWPEKYHDQQIDLWGVEDGKPVARAFFERHMHKIKRLRHPPSDNGAHAPSHAEVRYLSKNNANIARLPLLPDMFPGCDVVIPLRRPDAHCASLMRQHQNFLKMHTQDPFVMRYMRDIGHLEFGLLHKPLGFAGVLDDRLSPDYPDYWLRYWIAAFTAVLRQVEARQSGLHLLPQEDLRAAPSRVMNELLERLDLGRGANFEAAFHRYPDQAPTGMFSPALLNEANAIYAALAAVAAR